MLINKEEFIDTIIESIEVKHKDLIKKNYNTYFEFGLSDADAERLAMIDAMKEELYLLHKERIDNV